MSDLFVRWFVLSLNASLQVLLLALAATAGLKILRVRDSNLRHRVWVGVLVGMLLLPALSHVVPALELPIPIRREWIAALNPVEEKKELDEIAGEPSEPISAVDAAAPAAAPIGGIAIDEAGRAFTDFSRATRRNDHSNADGPHLIDRAHPVPENPAVGDHTGSLATGASESAGDVAMEVASAPEPAQLATSRLSFFPYVLAILWGIWLLGVAAMFLRFLAGVWMASQLRKKLTAIPALVSAHRPIPVLECPLIRVPLTLGWLRSQILLPPDWCEWTSDKLQAVLTHERTHVERGDCAVMLLAEINRSLYWFHPLAWWLKDHLSNLAEEACDDAAISSTGDRTLYATHLLEVAAVLSQKRSRFVDAGVSMARRPQVETRIDAILDFTRPLSRRMTLTTTLLLLVGIVPIIGLAAALRPVDRQQGAASDPIPDAELVPSDETIPVSSATEVAEIGIAPTSDVGERIAAGQSNSPIDSAPAVSKDADSDVIYAFAGTVVGPDGKSVAGAKITVSYARSAMPALPAPPAAVSDENGSFQFSAKKSDFSDAAQKTNWNVARAIATKDGFGFACGLLVHFDTNGLFRAELSELSEDFLKWMEPPAAPKTNKLVLVADDLPIRGRLFDTEGRPVVGALIDTVGVHAGLDGTLDAWETATNQKDAAHYTVMNEHLGTLVNGGALSGVLASIVSPVRTDAEGRFLLKGIGRDRIAHIFVSNPGIETQRFFARTRRGETITLLRDIHNPGFGSESYQPHEFTRAIGHSVPVTGQVTDVRTGNPLPGVRLRGSSVASESAIGSATARYIRTVTDKDGMYRIDGFPLGKNSFYVIPPAGSRYLAGGATVETTATSPVVMNVGLTPGVLLKGRAVDERTGRPIVGTLQYFAFQSNPHLKESTSFRQASIRAESVDNEYVFRTDTDGRFEIPVLPGQGILGIQTGIDFPVGVGADQIDCPKYDGPDRLFLTAPLICHAERLNLVVPIDPQPGADELTVDLSLRSGMRVVGRVLTPEGVPSTDYFLYGDDLSRPYWTTSRGESFTVRVYDPAKGRRMLFYHPEGNLVGELKLIGETPERVEATLRPGGTLVGRVVDADGEPIEHATFFTELGEGNRAAAFPEGGFQDQGIVISNFGNRKRISTDANGRFELNGIIPGLKYSAKVSAPRKVGNFNGNMVLGTVFTDVVVKPGETKELGDLRPKSNNPGAEQPAAEKNTADKPAGDDVTFIYAGTVVDDHDQPIARAQVKLEYGRRTATAEETATIATTDEMGRFEFSRRKSDFLDADFERGYRFANIVATKAGYGFALKPSLWFESSGKLATEVSEDEQKWMVQDNDGKTTVLTLVPDVPIRGRVIDVDGRPVSGAKVEPINVVGGRDGTLNAWEAATKDRNSHYESLRQHLRTLAHSMFRSGPRAIVAPATSTDANGNFTLHGLGRERIAEIFVSAPAIETQVLTVRSRPGEPIKVARSGPHVGKDDFVTFYPSEFTCVAGPSLTIEGRVTDGTTGVPLVGASIASGEQALKVSRLVQVGGASYVRAQADADGRYQLLGLPLSSSSPIVIQPPADSPCFVSSGYARIDAGKRSAVYNVALARGVFVHGQVADERMGRSVRGKVSYFAFQSNPHAVAAGFSPGRQRNDPIWTDENGRFTLVALPGKGFVTFEADEWQDYARGVGAGRIVADPADRTADGRLKTFPINGDVERAHCVVPLDIDPKAADPNIEMKPIRGTSVSVKLLAPDGQPLRDCYVLDSRLGETSLPSWWKSKQEHYELKGYFPEQTRRLMFCEPERNLAGVYDLKGPAPSRLEIKLQPGATIRGRVIADDRNPIENAVISDSVMRSDDPSQGHLLTYRYPEYVRTDARGRFEFKGVMPGLKYSAFVSNPEKPGYGLGAIFTDVTAEAGETRDLGDLTPQSEKRKQEKKAGEYGRDTAKEAAQPAESLPLSIRGQIVGPDGKPAVKALVAAIGMSRRPERGGDLVARSETLAETTTDDAGRFAIMLNGASSSTHSNAHLVARSNDSGLVWRELDLDAKTVEVPLRLPNEQPIRGRLIDIEGRPVSVARIAVRSVLIAGPPPTESRGAGCDDIVRPPQAWPQPLKTDDEGRFVIHHVAAGQGVYLEIEGTDRIARQGAAINTGQPERRGENDLTYRSLVRNVRPDEEAVLALAPAQIFEGVVRYADTGEPAPHARLTIYSSQQESGGSSIGVSGTSDAQGRYRINPYSGVRFGITAYPPNGVPYHIQRIDDIVRKEGATVKQVDVALRRGVLVRGRIVETDSAAPVAGASIQYVPASRSDRSETDGIISGWQGIQISDKQGAFEIVVVPGQGTLLAHGPGSKFVLQEIGSRQLDRGLAGGERNYAHAIEKINPTENSEPIEVTLPLKRSTPISGRITNQAGEPVERALVITRLSISPGSPTWRGFPVEALGGRFEVSGLGEGQECPVHFLDAKNRLGGTLIVRSNDPSRSAGKPEPAAVMLQPCGQAVARFVDSGGKPVAEYSPMFEIVVTPGPHRFEKSATASDELSADSAYVVNVDRTNYSDRPKVDTEGRITWPALIPGARYRVSTFASGNAIVLKDFVAESDKTLDLGEITVPMDKSADE